MTPARYKTATPAERARKVIFPRLVPFAWVLAVCLAGIPAAWSEGTPAGTVIDNIATVNFDLGGVSSTLDSNIVTFMVLERLDVVVTLQSAQVISAPGAIDRSILLTVTNTGNGSEAFELTFDSLLPGDDFDPIPAVPAIYFDTDSSGNFSAGDIAYVAGGNDPQLAADESVDVLLVNDIPAAVVDGELGRSELTATSATGIGIPGATLVGLGDGGVDAVVGASGGAASVFGEYIVSDVQISLTKSVAISDPQGGTEPTVGATLTYTVTVEVLNSGTITAGTFSDPIPEFTTFVAESIVLNGGALTDANDLDAGEFIANVTPEIAVQLGDLTQLDGIQTIEFQVTID
ncbi:MAG: hypothetical protein ACR2Q3_08230 [Woeseiaceae bacterium]